MTRNQKGEGSSVRKNSVEVVCHPASWEELLPQGLSSCFLSLTRATTDLKRFSESRIRTSKLTTFVNFPLRDLDLREFASENTSEYTRAGGKTEGGRQRGRR